MKGMEHLAATIGLGTAALRFMTALLNLWLAWKAAKERKKGKREESPKR